MRRIRHVIVIRRIHRIHRLDGSRIIEENHALRIDGTNRRMPGTGNQANRGRIPGPNGRTGA